MDSDLRCAVISVVVLFLLIIFTCRAGADLVRLYKLPSVQTYMNGLSSKEVHGDKLLYQHATLRKVC